MKFKHREAPRTFAVDTQAYKIEFCLARHTTAGIWTNQTYWSECRDFMGDAIYAHATEADVYVYGFSYTPTYKLPITYSAFGMKFQDEETKNKFVKNFWRMEDFDCLANTKPAELITFDKDPLTIVVKADKLWNKSMLTVSLYTFLLKCCIYAIDGTAFFDTVKQSYTTYKEWDGSKHKRPTNEANYLKKLDINQVYKLIRNIKAITKAVPMVHGATIYEKFHSGIHHGSGWYSTLYWKQNQFYKTMLELT